MSRRTIQSPGVEIREIDLTQRPAAAVGTSVFIAGFANQGPVDEIFNVGTFAEFEEIYGKPTTAAERYFYHSTKQVFDSDANVYVSRLPYGANGGTGTDGKSNRSALVYPVVSLNTLPITAIAGTSAGYLDFGDLSGKTSAATVTAATSSGKTGYFEFVSKDTNDKIKYYSFSAEVTGKVAGLQFSGTTNWTQLSAETVLKGSVYFKEDDIDLYAGAGTDASLSAGDYYVIGKPTLVDLTDTEYNQVLDNNITWDDDGDAGSGQAFTGAKSTLGKAGLIVLNTGGTTINNDFEGYYVGISDQSNATPTDNFDSVGAIYTTTTTQSDITPSSGYVTIPSSRIGFTLSAAGGTQASDSQSSISRTLETFSKFDIDGGEFIDTVNIGVFKVRNTPFANTDLELTSFLAEGYSGSLNSFRKTQNENGGAKKSFFIEDLDSNSANVKIVVNPNISKTSGDWTATNGDAPTKFVRVFRSGGSNNAAILNAYASENDGDNFGSTTTVAETQGLFPLGGYKDTKNDSTNKNIGSIPTKLDRVFNIASNVDLFTIDVAVEAGLGTVHAFGKSSTYTDTDYVDIGNASTGTGFYTTADNITSSTFATYRDDYRTIFNKFETFARQTRKDHIFIADVLRPIVVQGENNKVLDNKDNFFSKHVYWPLRHQFGFANSNFATTYGNWAKVYDGTSDKQIWIPFSGVAAKIYANNDANFAPWFAPAGFNRGVVTGVNDIAISPTQRQRDQLYRIAINPVTQFPAEGVVVFGQKTLQRKPTAFDRVNVRRLFLDLEKRTRETLKFFVFEPNTFLTRNRVVNTLTPIFENAKQTEGVYDYLIVCDERNNPASVIDQNELRVDIYLKPVRAAEFILVNFYAVNTDVNFEEIVGQ